MRNQPRLSVGTAFLATGALSLVLAGCSSDDTGTSDGSGSITYWSMWQESEPQAQVIAEAIEEFEEETGIEVDVEWQGRDNVTKVLAALQTGDVPDLIDQQYFSIKNAIVTNGQFVDVSDVYEMEIPGEGQSVRDAISEKYDIFTTDDDGAHFLVPYEIIAYSIWYDAAAMPEVAEAPPETWDQFADLLAASDADGRSPLALDADIAGYAAYWTSSALVRALGVGGLNALVAEEDAAGWSAPEVREAIAEIGELVENGYFIPGYDSSKFPAVQTRWAQGEADFLYMGSWAPTETGSVADEDFEYRSFNFPTLGDDDSLAASAIGFAIPGPADNADAAKEFLAYFLHQDRLAKIATDADNLTPRADIDVPEQLADVNELLNSKEIGPITDGIIGEHSDYDTRIFQPLSAQLMTGNLTADQFIEEISAEQVDFWQNAR